MRINMTESIAKCQKHVYRYAENGMIRFDKIQDHEEREKIELLADYLWLLKQYDEQAHRQITFSIEKR